MAPPTNVPQAEYENGQNGIYSWKHSETNFPEEEIYREEAPLDNTLSYSYETLWDTAQYLLSRTKTRPVVGIICGSGLGYLADDLEDKEYFPYEDIPNFPVSTVPGHHGKLVFGKLANKPVVCMQGRFHYYEGYPLWKCCLPIRIMKLLGVKYLIATNAAGGLNPNYKVGDLMIVRDHINMMGFSGNNPLMGPNDERFGPRFPPMNKAYDPELRNIVKEIGRELGLQDELHEGVYTCLGGPNFETVAELRMLKMTGVDAVGMSTVHEVVTARHCDIRVFALSMITNKCVTCYDDDSEANHEEVLECGKTKAALVGEVITKLIDKIDINAK